MFEEMRLRSFTMYLFIFFIIFGIAIILFSPKSDISIEILATIILFMLFPLFWFKKQMKKQNMHLMAVLSWSGVAKKIPSLFFITLTLMLFSISFLWIQTYLFSIIAPTFAEKQLIVAAEMVEEFENASFFHMLFIFVSTCGVAPIAEEFIFRGLFLKRIAKKTNMIVSLMVTNVLFAILHLDFVGSFMFGFLLSLIYVKTNNLLFPIIIHFINNTVLSLLVLFKIPMPDFLNYTDMEQVAVFMKPNLIIGLISLPLLVYYLYTYRLTPLPDTA